MGEKLPGCLTMYMTMMMMESPVGTTYELRSHSLLPVGPRMTDKADSCGESTMYMLLYKRPFHSFLASYIMP